MRAAQDTNDVRRDLVGLLPRLRRFALTLTHAVAEADDLVQAVCERATSRHQKWTGRERLDSCLYIMARTIRAEDMAKRKARGQTDVGTAAEAGAGKHEDPVQRALLALPDPLASIFLLVPVEGHTYREAADIMGVTPHAVATDLAAARLRLAAISPDIAGAKA